MEVRLKSMLLSLMIGISCSIFFGTLLPGRKSRREDSVIMAFTVRYLPSLAFAAGFMVLSVMEAPGYLLQPLRVIVMLCVVIRIFYQGSMKKIILLTVFWCAIYWTMNLAAMSVEYILSWQYEGRPGLSDWFCHIMFLCLSLLFGCRCRGWSKDWEETKTIRFIWLPAISLIVTIFMSLTVWFTDSLNKTEIVVAAAGYSVINVLAFYFAGNILEKEARLQKAQFAQSRLKNQIELIENIQANDMRYRRCLHDYKNQLGCIQGLLETGQTEEALGYVKELGGSIRKGQDHVNTNHPVVNTLLNQKYLCAQEKGITLVMAVNDLSGLLMGREDIVTLLVNLLDNAIEACEKLNENRLIQFKMMLEEGELTLSVRNPVKETVVVNGKTIRTTKADRNHHGLGMPNINAVIERYQGTSILECRDGWFYFSAVIPDEQKVRT